MSDFTLKNIRIKIPNLEIELSGKAEEYFDFLKSNTDITEEYLYAHQPSQESTIPVFSTSSKPIGYLDDSEETAKTFNILEGPVIVVARKGYAGRLFAVLVGKLIIHEDAYAVKPKQEVSKKVNLEWFAEHYSEEFQANRTSFWGIGDFPREKFKSMRVVIPKLAFQSKSLVIYKKRKQIISNIQNHSKDAEFKIGEVISRTLEDRKD